MQALNFLVEQDRLFQNTPDWGIDSFRFFWDKYSPLLLLPPPCSNMSLGGFGHHNTTVLKWVPGFGDLGPLFKF